MKPTSVREVYRKHVVRICYNAVWGINITKTLITCVHPGYIDETVLPRPILHVDQLPIEATRLITSILDLGAAGPWRQFVDWLRNNLDLLPEQFKRGYLLLDAGDE
jgi:hypothetical protein